MKTNPIALVGLAGLLPVTVAAEIDDPGFALRRIAPERLKGFLFATWESLLDDPKSLAKHDEYFKLAGKVIRNHSQGS